MKKKEKKIHLQAKKRFLKKIQGNLEKPRLCVFRSHKHIYAQLIDDINGETLVSSCTLEKNLRPNLPSTGTKEAALIVGENLAKKAIEKGIEKIVFDRGNRPYHGRIASLAEGARKKGLYF